MSSHLTRIARAAIAAALMLLTLSGLAVAGVVRSTSQSHAATPGGASPDRPPDRPSSGGRLVVAVALGASGTVGSDALAPFEVFASSPAFSVYTVAASAAPAPVDGGPAIVPTYTFADVAAGRATRPDVVVVPAVDDPDGEAEAPLRAWVVEQSQRGARILSVCAGARLLAATGLLEGRTATSHWSRISALTEQHPETRWVDGERYVDDGSITTTAGITSGIPGALHLVDQLAGTPEAVRVGRLVHYPNWSPTASTTIPVQSLTAADLPVALDLAVPWFRPTLGLALADGVSELDVASAFEVYSNSYAARAIAIATGSTVTTRHGVVLAAHPLADAPPLDRVVVPATSDGTAGGTQIRGWAAQQGLPVDALRGPGGDAGFDGGLEYLAATAGRATAVSAAKMIDYPTDTLELAEGTAGLRVPLLVVLGLLLAGAVGFVPTLVRRSVRRSAEPPATRPPRPRPPAVGRPSTTRPPADVVVPS
ncbi:Transcriptional regulator GlxA family, contains an amidase domain and an AraC-type DNA-binding HTH domain [Friedmanniella luteola]|uniref:Transcriptional regulator GlxA family, contains an amidase domain and an AraC-type DNA-binding HTH domain n=1 Tax=Friedmanniella luteola TaxID=546871 RepID=A0A1H1MQ64_9ACTN|nr:DJ-1/PfpI family protein [Friedmanniella luteola]SDR88921.1 Transcriptional regulator GlxA family, contains an amidase domain and an AraC-type DNA-binding HTH domain [Friedmanniella luteola]